MNVRTVKGWIVEKHVDLFFEREDEVLKFAAQLGEVYVEIPRVLPAVLTFEE